MFLFIHGTAATSSLWLPQIRGLLGLDYSFSDKLLLELFTISLPGHPSSDKSFSMEDAHLYISKFAKDKVAKQHALAQKLILSHPPQIIKTLQSPLLTIIGHSIGGAIALDYALHNPKEIEKVVSLSAGVRFNRFNVTLSDLFFKLFFKAKPEFITKLPKYMPNLRWKVAMTLFAENPQQKGFWSCEKLAQSYDLEKTYRQMSLSEQLRVLKIPILIINGRFDLLNTVGSAEKVKTLLDPRSAVHKTKKTIIESQTDKQPFENVTVRIYPWASHNVMDDDLVSFVFDVREFLAK